MKKIISVLLTMIMTFSFAVQLKAEESYTITLSEGIGVTVNGKEITKDTLVTDSDKVKLSVEDDNIKVIFADGKYYKTNSVIYLSENLDLTEAVGYSLGLSMVEGAQVRVGQVELSEDGRIDATADSGLRFIATADYMDTVIADENVEFGIKITAEGNDAPIYIKAEKFQNDDRSIFTAAITKLIENNYNRKFTACAYAIVPMHNGTEAEFTAGAVTRSVYQVSVGIMKHSSAEYDENLPYTIDDAVKNVLNAYVNQTGIRLTYSSDGKMSARTEGKGAYTGDVFFDVESSINENGGTDVVITPYGSDEGFGNEITLEEWWQEYIRINNNNSVATKYISNAKLENGVLSFTFTIPETAEYTFNQEDNVTIVSAVTGEYIKGFKNGDEVTYNLAETINVMGLAESMDDVVPGSVIMVGTNSEGKVSAVELVASLGLPIDPDSFEADFGVYDASDGSGKYKNVVTEMFSKTGSKVTCQSLPDTTKTTYKFESSSSMCYRVGIAMNGETPVITATGKNIGAYPSIFESTADYHNYLYLRYNSETGKVKECVFYCVPKNLDFSGDGEYSDIFSLDNYRVIIE